MSVISSLWDVLYSGHSKYTRGDPHDCFAVATGMVFMGHGSHSVTYCAPKALGEGGTTVALVTAITAVYILLWICKPD